MRGLLPRHLGWLFIAAALLPACSGGGPLEQLDERSGLTIVRGREPLVFARTEPRYSRSARDYVYLGPVETNRQGVLEYYLWVGIATTLDRGFLAPAAEEPRTLYIDVGGEPMELPLKPWHELVSTGLKDPVYATAVPVREELVARVTLQQLTLIDAAPLASIGVEMTPRTAPRPFVRWSDETSFRDFLEAVADGVATSVQ